MLNWTTLVVLLVGLLIVIALETAKRRTSFWHVRSILAIGIALLCAAHLVFFVLPVGPIGDILVGNICPTRRFDVSALTSWRTNRIWNDTLCSRVSGAVLPECGNTAPSRYENDLNNNFTAAILLSALLWMVGWRVLTLEPAESPDSPAWPEPIPWPLARTLLAISLLLVVVGDAYLYGKTVQSTVFPLTQVDLTAGAAQDDDGRSNRLYLIVTKADSTIFYDPLKDRVLFIRNSAVNSERTRSLTDVLSERISRRRDSCGED